MGLLTRSLAKKLQTYLHLLLVMGIFLYLYSPLLEHLLGSEASARLHTHIHVSEDVISHLFPHDELDLSDDAANQDPHEHEEGVLCLLDNNTVLLAFSMIPQAQIAHRLPLVSELVPFYFPVSIIYLSSLDPPPTI